MSATISTIAGATWVAAHSCRRGKFRKALTTQAPLRWQHAASRKDHDSRLSPIVRWLPTQHTRVQMQLPHVRLPHAQLPHEISTEWYIALVPGLGTARMTSCRRNYCSTTGCRCNESARRAIAGLRPRALRNIAPGARRARTPRQSGRYAGTRYFTRWSLPSKQYVNVVQSITTKSNDIIQSSSISILR